jgi:hypothetical protein
MKHRIAVLGAAYVGANAAGRLARPPPPPRDNRRSGDGVRINRVIALMMFW